MQMASVLMIGCVYTVHDVFTGFHTQQRDTHFEIADILSRFGLCTHLFFALGYFGIELRASVVTAPLSSKFFSSTYVLSQILLSLVLIFAPVGC